MIETKTVKIKKLKKMPVLVTSNLLKLYPTTVII